MRGTYINAQNVHIIQLIHMVAELKLALCVPSQLYLSQSLTAPNRHSLSRDNGLSRLMTLAVMPASF